MGILPMSTGWKPVLRNMGILAHVCGPSRLG
jgi:hypothetical protein